MSLLLISQAYSFSDDEDATPKASACELDGSECLSGKKRNKFFQCNRILIKSKRNPGKVDELKNESEISTPFLDLSDQIENEISKKTTGQKNDAKTSTTEKYPLKKSSKSCKPQHFIVPIRDKIQQRKTMALNQCIMCYKQFDRPSYIESHILTHIKEKPFSCNVCNESFAQLSKLKLHKFTHLEEKPFQCTTCTKRFAQQGSLKRHERIHSDENPFQCSVCGKRFTGPSHLKRHQRIHTGERPHQCTICNKRFAELSSLKSHKSVHTGEKPHQCKICNKRFTQKSTFKAHQRIHTGEKPFECQFCSRTFNRQSSLKRHERTHLE